MYFLENFSYCITCVNKVNIAQFISEITKQLWIMLHEIKKGGFQSLLYKHLRKEGGNATKGCFKNFRGKNVWMLEFLDMYFRGRILYNENWLYGFSRVYFVVRSRRTEKKIQLCNTPPCQVIIQCHLTLFMPIWGTCSKNLKHTKLLIKGLQNPLNINRIICYDITILLSIP